MRPGKARLGSDFGDAADVEVEGFEKDAEQDFSGGAKARAARFAEGGLWSAMGVYRRIPVLWAGAAIAPGHLPAMPVDYGRAAAGRSVLARALDRQGPVAFGRDRPAERGLIGGEDERAAPSPRNGHVELLLMGREPGARVGEKDRIDGLALAPIGRGRVAVVEDALAGGEHLLPAPVGFDGDGAIGEDFADRDQFPVGQGLAVQGPAVHLELEPVAGGKVQGAAPGPGPGGRRSGRRLWCGGRFSGG